MATVKYGAFITDMKGKVGGTVFQGGPAGPVAKCIDAIRDSAKLTKADAGRVINTLPITAQVAGLWRTLTDAERASWSTGAVNYPAFNKFGVSYTPSGYQVFMTLNFQVYQLTGAILYSCPVPITVNNPPAFSIAQPDLTSLDVTWVGGIQTDCTIRVEATQPMGQGRKPKNSFYKVISEWPDSTASPTDLFPAYALVYGSFPINASIYFRFTSYANATGQKSVPIVVALLTA